MKKIEKGQYGYLKSYERKKLITLFALLIMILFDVITTVYMYGSTKHVLIVFAILLALPFAKTFISYIICFKFTSLDNETYQGISEAASKQSGKVIYDVTISQYEGIKFYQSVCIKNGNVYALVLDKKYEENKNEYKKWLTKAVTHSMYDYKVTVFTDVDLYIKKLISSGEPNEKNIVIDKYMLELVLTTNI